MKKQLLGRVASLVDIGTYSFDEVPLYVRYELAALYMRSIPLSERWECLIENGYCEELPHFIIHFLEAYGTSHFQEAKDALVQYLANGISDYLRKPLDELFELMSQEKNLESETPYG